MHVSCLWFAPDLLASKSRLSSGFHKKHHHSQYFTFSVDFSEIYGESSQHIYPFHLLTASLSFSLFLFLLHLQNNKFFPWVIQNTPYHIRFFPYAYPISIPTVPMGPCSSASHLLSTLSLSEYNSQTHPVTSSEGIVVNDTFFITWYSSSKIPIGIERFLVKSPRLFTTWTKLLMKEKQQNSKQYLKICLTLIAIKAKFWEMKNT